MKVVAYVFHRTVWYATFFWLLSPIAKFGYYVHCTFCMNSVGQSSVSEALEYTLRFGGSLFWVLVFGVVLFVFFVFSFHFW